MSLNQQMSLRVSEDHREVVRSKLEEMRRQAPDPDKVSEADAVRKIIEEAAARKVAQ